MDLLRLRGEVDQGAFLAVSSGADPGDDLLIQGGVLRSTAEECVRAELLDHRDPDRQPLVGDVERLRADPQYQGLVGADLGQQAAFDRMSRSSLSTAGVSLPGYTRVAPLNETVAMSRFLSFACRTIRTTTTCATSRPATSSR